MIKKNLYDVYSDYCRSNNLYDKYGIATVCISKHKTQGKWIFKLEDAHKLKPTVYIAGSHQKVKKYMLENM